MDVILNTLYLNGGHSYEENVYESVIISSTY
jgi:hypothetical protein